jgi:protein phosphatase
MTWNYAGQTHPGNREGENEDAIGWDESSAVWLVADGMGGHASGQVASRIARDTVLQKIGAAVSLEEAIGDAHETIRQQAAGDDVQRGMGTTIVVAQIRDGLLNIFWVGDSRAYLLRHHELEQISTDHSFVELLREKVGMSEEEIRIHPHKNLVTRTLGHEDPEASSRSVPLMQGDRILLCSDGLNDELADAEISVILDHVASPSACCEALVQAAMAQGGRDNISVVVVDYEGDSHPDARKTTSEKTTSNLKDVLQFAGMGMMSAAVVLAIAWYFLR